MRTLQRLFALTALACSGTEEEPADDGTSPVDTSTASVPNTDTADTPSGDTPDLIRGHLQLQSLNYTYAGSATPVLEDISLDVRPGETIAIMGRVGSGKTTLLRLLVRLLDPPRGTVAIEMH